MLSSFYKLLEANIQFSPRQHSSHLMGSGTIQNQSNKNYSIAPNELCFPENLEN